MSLVFENLYIPAAQLYNENPLPDISGLTRPLGDIKFGSEIDEEEKNNYYYGRVQTILPYCMQDNYDRVKVVRPLKVAVLENEYLKATFLLEYGGRLYSLYDKKENRELLHKNPVFQPANLALRNAWFSGGVEWNIGMTGHTPFTVSPLFIAKGQMEDGTPVLRMYEWERIRRVAYSVDAYLPENSRFLFVRVSIINDNDETVPMYWWSNIAVDQTEHTRVIVPAHKAYVHDGPRGIDKDPVPVKDNIDRSYPTRIPYAFDQFFDIPKEERKWITALDKEGRGLIQTSTDRLIGRKLFDWGNTPGGRRWQEYLSVKGSEYLEIQAGIAHMQQERVPMPGNTVWDWTEAYGYIEADRDIAHGEDWTAACREVGNRLEEKLPRSFVEKVHESFNIKNVELVYNGSGWCSLELKRKNSGSSIKGLVFDYMNEEQQPWLKLLNEGIFEEVSVSCEPAKYLVQKEWITLLENAIESDKKNKNWHSFYQLGVMKAANNDLEGGIDAFMKSISLKPNAWAYRCLAILKDECLYMYEAVKLLPIAPIVIECLTMFNGNGRYEDTITLRSTLDEELKNNRRVLLSYVDALIMTDVFDEAEELLISGIEPDDIREGEVLLSDLWYKLHTRKIMKEENLADDMYRETLARVKKEMVLPDSLNFIMQ